MTIDESFAIAQTLCDELQPRLEEIETEQDARFQVINRFLTEVLGWPFADIKTEPHSSSGYADYLLSSSGQKCFVIEAKKIGPILVDTRCPDMRPYKVDGPALSSAREGIEQAAKYCLDHGVNYAALTTGNTWITFLLMPGTGVSYKEGKAYVFPNLQSILDNFAAFYDLFSKEGLLTKTYNIHFAKADGLSVKEFEPLVSATPPETIKMLPTSELAADLEVVFKEFFGALSGDADRQMLLDCFVETRESRFADASLEKIVRNVSSAISELDASSNGQLAREIKAAVEIGRGETVIIVGNKGAGKSTFIERFFDSVLDTSTRTHCLLIKVDLLKATADIGQIETWLTTKIMERFEALLYDEGLPTYEQLQGLYFTEYQRWMRGHYKPLYESNKEEFKIKFGEFLGQQIEKDPYNYILKTLDDVIRNRKMLPCLVFDNIDHFDGKFREAVFQYSQAIRSSLPFTFVVLPVTDRSLWSLSKSEPFRTYSTKMFYLPVPPTKEVLEKRVSYLKRRVEEERNTHQYFFGKGIKLNIEKINGFASCLEEIFLREDYVARRISWLANNNIHDCLRLTQQVIMSPFLSVDDLVKAFLANGQGFSLTLSQRSFMQALLQGKYNVFRQDLSKHILNLFETSPYFPTSPLLHLSILKLLIDKAGETTGADSYCSVDQIRRYFMAMNLTEQAIDHALAVLLRFRLIETYDTSDDSIEASQRVAVAHSGRIHYEMSLNDQYYIGCMTFVTPLRDAHAIDYLRTIKTQKMGISHWIDAQKKFISTCLVLDSLYAKLPTDPIYAGQVQLRKDIRSRWVDGIVVGSVCADEHANAENFNISQTTSTVKWFSLEKGYGFVEAGIGRDVFLHRSTLQKVEINEVKEGDTLICDIAESSRGTPQVIAVYSHEEAKIEPQKLVSDEDIFEGVVDFYNSEKCYGFVKSIDLPDDIYVSSKVLEANGLPALLTGASVLMTVETGRFGKGYMATSIVLSNEQKDVANAVA